eukprot:12843373-Prorocentrum_lima.AAC.1
MGGRFLNSKPGPPMGTHRGEDQATGAPSQWEESSPEKSRGPHSDSQTHQHGEEDVSEQNSIA